MYDPQAIEPTRTHWRAFNEGTLKPEDFGADRVVFTLAGEDGPDLHHEFRAGLPPVFQPAGIASTGDPVRKVTVERDGQVISTRWQAPHPPAAKPRQDAARRAAGWMIPGVILIAARLIIPAIPDLITRDSLNQAQGICSGPIGQIAGALDSTVQGHCNDVSTVMTLLNLGGLAGLILIVVFGVLWLRASGTIRTAS